MDIRLDYGKQGLDVTLPDHLNIRTLSYKVATPVADQPNQSDRAALQEVFDSPTDTPPLSEIIQGRSSACIVICDITRPVPNQLILEPLLETLHAGGITPANVKILIATGLHRPSHPAEIVEMVGADIAAKYTIIITMHRTETNWSFLASRRVVFQCGLILTIWKRTLKLPWG